MTFSATSRLPCVCAPPPLASSPEAFAPSPASSIQEWLFLARHEWALEPQHPRGSFSSPTLLLLCLPQCSHWSLSWRTVARSWQRLTLSWKILSQSDWDWGSEWWVGRWQVYWIVEGMVVWLVGKMVGSLEMWWFPWGKSRTRRTRNKKSHKSFTW